MQISFESLEFGQTYERPFLARFWGYQSFHALSKGVVTPASTKYIIFFVTKEKQELLTQYNDYIDGNMLFWEGEEKHSSDQRVIEADRNGDEIHLFYREIHHTPFVYFGKITLTDFQLRERKPSEFAFRIDALMDETDSFLQIGEYAGKYRILEQTEQDRLAKSRIGQGEFRRNVVKLWGRCSVTGLHNISLLRASHIKPWKQSTNEERLDPYNGFLLTPNYDILFDKGYITFRDNGKILISNRLIPFAREVFDVDANLELRNVFPKNKEYLEFHRSVVFKSL